MFKSEFEMEWFNAFVLRPRENTRVLELGVVERERVEEKREGRDRVRLGVELRVAGGIEVDKLSKVEGEDIVEGVGADLFVRLDCI